MRRALWAVGLMLALSACASEPRRGEFRHRGGPPGEGRGMGRNRLFISPSGEPFRGEDGLSAWFAQADADHDGALTLAEFQADAARFFRYLDANGDGVIDASEIQAYERNIAPEIAANDFDRPSAAEGGEDRRAGGGMGGGGRGGRRGGGGMGRGGGMGGGGPNGGGHGMTALEGASRYALINEPEPVANADTNLDSKVTMEEWRAATARRFLQLDKAKTGRLTLDGLKGKAAPQKPPGS
jgi:hypothetical protein